jgi:hypothetical protein
MNTEKLISLKENFTGQRFQWIKTDRPELLGKVVKCRDVNPMSDGRFIVVFDDGSKIDSTRLNSDLLMIHGDMQPLSKGEVEAIYKPKLNHAVPPAKPANASVPLEPAQAAPRPPFQPAQPAPQKTNMFSMFNSEESQLTLTLNVRIPDRKLLKLMYSNAEDKDKFLSELAEHLHTMINKQVVKDSVESILAPAASKKEPKPTIQLREV